MNDANQDSSPDKDDKYPADGDVSSVSSCESVPTVINSSLRSRDCQMKSKYLSAFNYSRENIRKHLRKIHTKDDLEKFNVLCCELDNDKPQTPIPEQLGKLSTQRKLSFSRYQKIITQKMLDDYILEYLCEAVLPVYHTERYDFRKFVCSYDYALD
ncbi:hypothetical protein OUZ56_005561 [Daphnia magna]|uniref:Uncharacterized protein n=1 Tax=Daphnia magna TaxID=35525 RepID=A0ABQ9YT42_9CRUS|nr:hypothetical protein OUZ56_005561 [Daphnia magna]